MLRRLGLLLILVALASCVGEHRQMFGLGPDIARSATLLPNGKQTFVDANGVPLAGGTVAFYIPNTLTPKTTWQDPGQTTPNANPLTLDSAGRAIIYGSGTYRQIVRDQFNNLIWDQLTADTASPGIAVGGTSTGTGNAQVVTATTFTATNGQIVTYIAGFTNTGAVTLNAGTGPIPVDKDTSFGPVPLTGGEIVAGNSVTVVYDSIGGIFHMVSTPPTGDNAPGAATITPTTLSVNTDNWNPTGLQGASVIRISASANINLNGIQAQPAGTVITLENIGGFSIAVLPNQASSSAANRFALPRPELLQPGQSLKLIYDGPLAEWALNQATPSVVLPVGAKRQTVLSGPTSGTLPSFLPATSASLTLTMQNVAPTTPLTITAAFGFNLSGSVDYLCQIIGNQSWTATASNTNYLIETINNDGSCTPSVTILSPVYQAGGSISVTNGQYTFDYLHYQMWLGNGATAVQVSAVIVGEAVAGAGSISSTAMYGYNGYLESGTTTPLPTISTGITFSFGLGTKEVDAEMVVTNLTSELFYPVGIENPGVQTSGVSGVANNFSFSVGSGSIKSITGSSTAWVAVNLGTGANSPLTLADWNYKIIAKRRW